MKKVKLLLAMAVIVFSIMLCFSMNAFALTEGDWEFQLLDNEVMITKYLGDDVDVVVPDTIYGCPVTEITDMDIFSKVKPKSITVPGTVKKAGFNVSYGWDELETLIYEDGVEHINACSISSFKNLKNVKLSSTLKTIGEYTFRNTPSLKNIDVPASVTSIENRAFENSGLTKIDINQLRNVKMGNFIFRDCVNLEELILPQDMTVVPPSLASGCVKLNKIDLPVTVKKIEYHAFNETGISQVILPSGLETVQMGAFAQTQLIELVIPYGTKVVEDIFVGPNGFGEDCLTMKSLFLPDTVTSIDNYIDRCPNAIVYCSAGSKAEAACKRYKASYLTDNSVNSGIHVYYNGKRISFHSYGQNPEILEGRTLVPLRSIFEAMGAEVEWDGATSTAIAKRGNVEVKIQIGVNEIYKNGKAIAVDVPAQLVNERTMVPARVIAEAFGADVQWNGNGRTVLISENR